MNVMMLIKFLFSYDPIGLYFLQFEIWVIVVRCFYFEEKLHPVLLRHIWFDSPSVQLEKSSLRAAPLSGHCWKHINHSKVIFRTITSSPKHNPVVNY